MADQIEPCTTHSAKKRHYSAHMRDRYSGYMSYRSGRTLCGYIALDEAGANRWRSKPVSIASLPECGSCARSKARREREAQGED